MGCTNGSFKTKWSSGLTFAVCQSNVWKGSLLHLLSSLIGQCQRNTLSLNYVSQPNNCDLWSTTVSSANSQEICISINNTIAWGNKIATRLSFYIDYIYLDSGLNIFLKLKFLVFFLTWLEYLKVHVRKYTENQWIVHFIWVYGMQIMSQ